MTSTPPGGSHRQYDSVSDAIPPAEPLHGAHETYEKGEVSSIGALISDISSDLSTLIQQEVALAKAEAKQSATRAGKGIGMLAAAGIAGFFLLLFLSLALWWALADLIDSGGWAFVLVALLWAVVAAVLGMAGKGQFKDVGMEHTVQTAKRVPAALKGNEDPR